MYISARANMLLAYPPNKSFYSLDTFSLSCMCGNWYSGLLVSDVSVATFRDAVEKYAMQLVFARMTFNLNRFRSGGSASRCRLAGGKLVQIEFVTAPRAVVRKSTMRFAVDGDLWLACKSAFRDAKGERDRRCFVQSLMKFTICERRTRMGDLFIRNAGHTGSFS